MTNHPTPSSRRDFIKTSTLAVSAGALGSLALSSRAYAAGDDTIRVGLIGCGGRGSGAAGQALSTKGNVKLVAMGDAFSERLEGSLKNLSKKFTSQPGRVDVDADHKFVGFDAYEKVLASDVDLVILATPPGFRPIHFEAAVAAGKHIFMEKPVATDCPGVRSVLESAQRAKEKNLKVGVGLQRHHQFPYMETVNRIHDGEIGDIVALRVYWNGGGVWDPRRSRDQVKTEMEYQMWSWYYYNWLCGDHIVEQHIHNLDVGNWVKQSYPTECHGMGGREVRKHKKYGEIFDHHAVEYAYADGTRMFSQCRHIRNCWNSVTEHAIGTNGTADISGHRLAFADGNKWRSSANKNDPYQTEHDDLFAAIRENETYNEADNGAFSTLTAIMGRMATYSGKIIKWDDALNSELSIMPSEFAWDAELPNQPDSDGVYSVPVPGVTKVL